MAAEIGTNRKALNYTWHTITDEGFKTPGQRRIVVVGVGGVGNNTITRLMQMGITGAEALALDTDTLDLNASSAKKRVLIGRKTTQGIGTLGDPALGVAAIEVSREDLKKVLTGADIIFITAGLGEEIGSSAAPVVAKIAKLGGAITVGMVTTSFRIEEGRKEDTTKALEEMRRECDIVVVLDNDKLLTMTPQLSIDKTFTVTNQVLANMIKGIVETISVPSLINLDFADFKTIVKHGGVAFVGVGESNAPNRAEEAVRNALRSPSLDIENFGATGALIHVSGDEQMTIEEVNRVGEIVTETMNGKVPVICGARVYQGMEGVLRVTLVMTGTHSTRVPRGFSTIAPQLFNLEPNSEPEKPLDVNLGIPQLEWFTD